ncbi:GNAT family N-acetyltransferase [Pseudodesulfovibrio sp.]|uniref:GNAT family N-acetyltransferase n=1 Tax=unclassified Pseudodesulfovibrio TaxID=2661612 RepID=UPI003AFF67A6
MSLTVKLDCSGIDWEAVANLLRRVGMAHYDPAVHERAFTASHATVFILDDGKLVGFGRAISDGEYQAAVYDCAVDPECQGKGVGSLIMKHILDGVAGCNVILYAAPGKEGFYRKQGFSDMRTGMAKFTSVDIMRDKGFIE